MCRKLSARWGCFIHGQPRVSRRMEHNETTATLDKLQTNTFFLLLSNTSCIINNRVLFPFERKKRIILWLVSASCFVSLFYWLIKTYLKPKKNFRFSIYFIFIFREYGSISPRIFTELFVKKQKACNRFFFKKFEFIVGWSSSMRNKRFFSIQRIHIFANQSGEDKNYCGVVLS